MSDKTKIEVGKLSDFKPTKVNSNKHTAKGLSALDKSMSEDGYVAPITVAADGEVLDGDARLERAFEKFGDKAIIVRHDGKTPVVMVREDIPNANDATARRIHYRANMVHWLDFSLDPAVVMADMESGFDFEAIGVSLGELGEMLEGGVNELLRTQGEEVDNPEDEWKGMPEFEQESIEAFQSIHVHFKTQEDVSIFAKLVGQKISENTRSIWYPEVERINQTDIYINDP